MYQTGTGTSKNPAEAEHWYRRAGSDGSGRAEAYLGSLLRQRQDSKGEREAFEASAAKGYAPASYHLGQMYMFGLGVPVDHARAYAYFEEAANRGHLFARRMLARRMLMGRLGLRYVPAGLAGYFAVVWTAVRSGWRDPDAEQFLRL
jgi:TPR repeat protein